MSDNYDAIVIGSGLGGLTAGALYARTGARVLLLERNASFGGAATTYHRGPLVIEASLHETTHPASAGGDPKREVFEALDLDASVELVPVGDFQEVRSPLLGKPFVLPHGLDAVEGRLAERFPQDRKGIHAFVRQLKRTLKLGELASPEHGFVWGMTHAAELPLGLWAVMRDARSSLSAVLTRYFGDNEAIKFAVAANLGYYTDDPDTFWWLGYAVAQGGYLRGGGYFIKGGSQVLSNRLAEIIREEGGETLTRCPAVGVELGPDDDVTGVRYRRADNDDETTARAPIVFANAAPQVIAALLPAPQRTAFMEPFRNRPLSISLASATIGVTKPPSTFGVSSYSTILIPGWMQKLSDFKHGTALLAEPPGERLPAFGVADYSRIDSGLTDGDVFPLSIVCADRLENWPETSEAAYKRKRDAWLDAIIARLDEEWPGIAAAVVEKSMATARTMHEYLNTPGGAVYGFALAVPEHVPKGPPQTFATSVKGLFLASAYSGFGGFTGTMAGGAGAVRAALRYRG